MLRSGEMLAAHRDELFGLEGENSRFEVPLYSQGIVRSAIK